MLQSYHQNAEQFEITFNKDKYNGLPDKMKAIIANAVDAASADMVSEQDARYLPTHYPQARLLNHWNAGGLLIFYTRGAGPLFVDGRAATAYPDDLLRDYFALVHMEINEAAWDKVIEKYRIDAVLWVKAHEQLRRFLVDKRGWKEEHAGEFDTIYVKPRG